MLRDRHPQEVPGKRRLLTIVCAATANLIKCCNCKGHGEIKVRPLVSVGILANPPCPSQFETLLDMVTESDMNCQYLGVSFFLRDPFVVVKGKLKEKPPIV